MAPTVGDLRFCAPGGDVPCPHRAALPQQGPSSLLPAAASPGREGGEKSAHTRHIWQDVALAELGVAAGEEGGRGGALTEQLFQLQKLALSDEIHIKMPHSAHRYNHVPYLHVGHSS